LAFDKYLWQNNNYFKTIKHPTIEKIVNRVKVESKFKKDENSTLWSVHQLNLVEETNNTLICDA